MKIWLIMSGEPLEYFGERPHRIGVFSKLLSKHGHDVTWWTSTYDHQHKKYLFDSDTEVTSKDGVNMFFLNPKTSYSNNVSYKRIINHKQIAEKFRKSASKKELPDIVLCCYPTIDLAQVAVNYGINNNVPVVIDVRDMWPDIFKELLPKSLTFFSNFFLLPLKMRAKSIFSKAYAITGITDEFVNFGLRYAKRVKTEKDKAFPFGYPLTTVSEYDKVKVLENLKSKGIIFDYHFTICFFGTIGKQFVFEPIIKAANELKGENVQFIICGVGDHLDDLRKQAEGLKIITPGWLDKKELTVTMEFSHIGLSPYVKNDNFLSNFTNKNIEYLAGKLPVLTSISGVSGKVFEKYDCGFVYNQSAKILKEKILLLKENPEIRDKMSGNAFSLFKEKFLADKVYGDMMLYLEKIKNQYKNESIS